MNSIYTYKINEELLRVQKVEIDDFNNLHFFRSQDQIESFKRIADLYSDIIVKNYSFIFGTLVLFKLPADLNVPVPYFDNRFGEIYSREAIIKINFMDNIEIKNDEFVFKSEETKKLFETLKNRNLLRVVKGKRKYLAFLPVGKLGLLSNEEVKPLRFNSSFFTMDLFDLGSPLDRLGVPVGLNVKNGEIINPPAFNRETLVIKNNKATVKVIKLSDIRIIVDGKEYTDKINAHFYERPMYKRSNKSKMDLIIIDDEIVAIKKGGESIVPSGGYVVGLDEEIKVKDRSVKYSGLEDISFALQVGNSVVRDGNVIKKFISPFYNIYRLIGTSFPPSLYPLNYKKDRAARIVLGLSKENKMIVLWFEGKPKFNYQKGIDSIGATLMETAKISYELGIYNGINLDGGGSAEILINGKRELKVADREVSGEEKERGIPCGLYLM